MKYVKRWDALILAAAITATCVGMSIGAALDRSSNTWDAMFYALVAGVLLAGSHVLPAMSNRRRPEIWVLAILCVVMSLYHLLHFFSAAEERAGRSRTTGTVAVGQAQAQAIRDELARIKARPLTVVATELNHAQQTHQRATASAARCSGKGCTYAQSVVSTARGRLDVLTIEYQAAMRSDTLTQQLSHLAAQADQAATRQLRDPVNARIAAVTGWDEQAVALAAGLAQGALLEMLGIAAWLIALGNRESTSSDSETAKDGRTGLGTGSPPPRPRGQPAFIQRAPTSKERAVEPLGWRGWLYALLRRASAALRILRGNRHLQHTKQLR